MISIIVCAVIGQFKVGDEVYVPLMVEVYQTVEDAAIRRNGVARPYDNGKIIAIKEVDGESIARIEREGYELPVWALMKNIKAFDEDAKKAAVEYSKKVVNDFRGKVRDSIGQDMAKQANQMRNNLMERLRPYCVTKPEHDALTVAVGKGLDPITMTAEQAQALSPSQRRALSSVKARYLKGRKK